MSRVVHAHKSGELVAIVRRNHPASDGYDKANPWLHLYVSGRVERHPDYKSAFAEMQKTWGRDASYQHHRDATLTRHAEASATAHA